MDYYQVLRVSPGASTKEIEQAYQRLMKEARYDTSIDRRLIENAYRTLSNTQTKYQYDALQNLKTKRGTKVAEDPDKTSYNPIEWIKKRTRKQLLITLAIITVIGIGFYSMRFGYILKDFQAGDVLYENLTNQRFGKILRVEHDYRFGDELIDAYQVELDPKIRTLRRSESIVWLPQESVKARCYKKK